MAVTITLNSPSGKASIYRGNRDTAIESNPFADIGKVLFHSDLPYNGVVAIYSGSVALTNANYNSQNRKRVNLIAHGLDYTPMIFAQMDDVVFYDDNNNAQSPVDIPFAGTVPWGNNVTVSWGRLLDIGVDATHIYLIDRKVHGSINPATGTLNYTVFVTDYAL